MLVIHCRHGLQTTTSVYMLLRWHDGLWKNQMGTKIINGW